VIRFDGRDLQPDPSSLRDALHDVLDRNPDGRRVVVLLDSCERLSGLDRVVARRRAPRLPATSIAVTAGRPRPPVEWRTDPTWTGLVRTMPLRNLPPGDSRAFLMASGVDEAQHERILELTHGHPLGLALMSEVSLRGGSPPPDKMSPDVVATLLHRFVEVVPSSLHRRAVGIAAVARVTTEDLLREALGIDDAHELFGWLRELSFMECGPSGLRLGSHLQQHRPEIGVGGQPQSLVGEAVQPLVGGLGVRGRGALRITRLGEMRGDVGEVAGVLPKRVGQHGMQPGALLPHHLVGDRFGDEVVSGGPAMLAQAAQVQLRERLQVG